MRTALVASSVALFLAACATLTHPGSGAMSEEHEHEHHHGSPRDLTGMPTWDVGEGDLAAAAAALALPADFEHFLEENPSDEQRHARSESTYANVLVLDGMTSERFIGAMQGMKHALDVRCTFCHDPQNFADDGKGEKKTARNMLLASQRIDAEHFGGKSRVTCWTCHRGKEKPAQPPDDFAKKASALALPNGLATPPDDPKILAGKFYKNLRWLDRMPAKALLPAMQRFAASLGKDCAFCHVPGNWESDEKAEKKAARDMIQLANQANAQFFGTREDEDAVSCWTCHRGQVKPERLKGVAEK